jgi:urea carboxylase
MAPPTKVLIANRGEISLRAQRACAALGVPCVAVFAAPDALSLHVLRAAESVCLGPAPRAYLDADRLLEVAAATGCNAVFPGYGFLSENADFAERCEAAGVAFMGPTPVTMRQFAQKHTARALAEAAGVPVLPGTPLLSSGAEATAAAAVIGLPVLLKATGGGGGIGIHICRTVEEVAEKFASAARQGAASFGDAGVFIEKYVERARHIEVQIFGDGAGGIAAFPERECSIQRRHQKVLEETPSPFVATRPALRAALQGAAVRLGKVAAYRSAGTVEFILDDATGEFYFLEVNTRLQVEHGITEMVSGVDLVAWMLQLVGASAEKATAPGALLPADLAAYAPPEPDGAAIEARVCAEDPAHDYRPCTGVLGEVGWPAGAGVRVDTWVEAGSEVPPHYDSLLAKVMVHAADRAAATAAMQGALAGTRLGGLVTNLGLLRAVVAAPAFAAGATTTRFLEALDAPARFVEVVDAGLLTTVQDWPGRCARALGEERWSVGVPPSGPMDALAHRLANAAVGNADDDAALEITLAGPALRFLAPATVAVCGAEAAVTLDGAPAPAWCAFRVAAGQVVAVGDATRGARLYLAVAGGLDVPRYLGSRATFPGGALGGHQGRALRPGDMLPLGGDAADVPPAGAEVPTAWRPPLAGGAARWEVGVLPGPQAAPDYFTEEDVATFFSTEFRVHHNSNRLGVRLEGPRPQFARADGGEGGSHPSNVHDHVYALGAINYTGDMPVVLTVDGPSLGGFVCPATIVSGEVWKMGQVRPGDTILFRRLTLEEAAATRAHTDERVALLRAVARGALAPATAAAAAAAFAPPPPLDCPPTAAVLRTWPATASSPGAQLRLAGDRYVFLEYGPMALDLALRVRVAEVEAWLAAQGVDGLLETSPGVRSVMIEYDTARLPLSALIALLDRAEAELPPASEATIRSRVVRLPLAFDDRWTRDAIAKYARSIRAEAPYVPSNVQFVAANNGLGGEGAGEAAAADAVAAVLFAASYMVLGLGDVYLGAPCAVPLDPRHRLVVPKYNPARTSTPEGAVGIGGCYMCIYPMGSPGGYQLVGRTLPIWNAFARAGPFAPGKPWLLRNFDQVRYYRVSEEELERLRADFANGRLELDVTEEDFDMRAYNALVAEAEAEAAPMRARQRAAMAEQMALDAEQLARADSAKPTGGDAGGGMGGGGGEDPFAGREGAVVRAAVTGTVWELRCAPGQAVAAGDTLMVLEAMKMEYAVLAPTAGVVAALAVGAGDMVPQGSALALLEPAA